MPAISRRSVLSAAAALPFAVRPAFAQKGSRYPDRPIRFVVPNNAGGIADSIARILQPRMGEELGQPIVVENRPGASGALAATAVAQSPPDGLTWLIDGPSNVIVPLLNKNITINYRAELAPVSQVMELPYVFGVRKDFPADDLAGLAAEAKRRPGEVTYGTTGAATTGHFMGALLQLRAGIQLNHIPFKGGAEVSRELLAGRLDMGMLSYNSLLPALEAGAARIIAVPGGKRHPKLPTIATVGETYPGYDITSWTGLFVPAGTPDAVQDRIVEALHVALKDPKVAAQIEATGCLPAMVSRNQFRAMIEHDQAQYADLIKQTGIKSE